MAKLGPWAQIKKSHVRLAGRDLPIGQLVAAWGNTPAGREGPPVQLTAPDVDDPGLILPRLRLSQPKWPEDVPQPPRRVSFAQLDEGQRWVYLDWLTRREGLPGLGYAYLYLYGLEAGLFGRQPAAACTEIQRVFDECQDTVFQAQAAFDVALGGWLMSNADFFAWTVSRMAWDGPYAGFLLWLQARLGLGLTPHQILSLSPACGCTPPTRPGERLGECVQIGLSAFEENAGVPLLQHFVQALAGQEQPLEIRLANPAARFSLPAVDLLAHEPFQQAVRDLVAMAGREADASNLPAPDLAEGQAAPASQQGREWYAVIEFDDPPSSYLDRIVTFAQKQPGYSKLLDEKRRLVHRVIFGRAQTRSFWQLLNMVRSWKSTRVYVNGEERDPAHVWL
ncbi:MAG: TerB N-terminal domain-containing protein [Thermoflexales bacterium]|nr:TerB N-terminal domain-containing protein [Thermoflexales bacterium]